MQQQQHFEQQQGNNFSFGASNMGNQQQELQLTRKYFQVFFLCSDNAKVFTKVNTKIFTFVVITCFFY